MKILRLGCVIPSMEATLHLVSRYGGSLQLVQDPQSTFSDAQELAELVEKHEADMVEVGSFTLDLLAECLDPESGVEVPIIQALYEMDVKTGNSYFSHYVRLRGVQTLTDPL